MGMGSRIRERRRELGLSQDELAQKVGYKNRSTIARIESDENDVTQSKLKEIAQALKTQVPWLMYGDERFKDSRYVEVSVGFDTSRKTKQPYYIDPEVAAIANELDKIGFLPIYMPYFSSLSVYIAYIFCTSQTF